MLPRAERLTKAGLFQRTHAGRKSIEVPPLALYVLERQRQSARRPPLVGFVIGKKVYARAVQRNRAKRRVREAYRLVRKTTMSGASEARDNLQQWYSLVFHIRLEALEVPFQEIVRAVEQSLTLAAQKYGRRIQEKKNKS